MPDYPADEAANKLGELIDAALAGEHIVIITADGRRVRLMPMRPRRVFGSMKGRVKVAPNFDADDNDFERLFYGDDPPKKP
ncbi:MULTISPECIES: type II toxin-antitoxin system Phd/YefM family antitoxin [Noviherbaspirillum]|uniref:type II toxin-antitoxin system Phd/YefM family antitoxin n=1 Tax=Noviherbaspirillum TaxID=1344552 RepID=UPI00124ED679|nr:MULTISPECIES: type II toxin-antitoxin system prevent-host-death family antitoxin [Noviherbaspirillum]